MLYLEWLADQAEKVVPEPRFWYRFMLLQRGCGIDAHRNSRGWTWEKGRDWVYSWRINVRSWGVAVSSYSFQQSPKNSSIAWLKLHFSRSNLSHARYVEILVPRSCPRSGSKDSPWKLIQGLHPKYSHADIGLVQHCAYQLFKNFYWINGPRFQRISQH